MMTMEEEFFRKTKMDVNKIIEYGFKKDKSSYKYSKNIMDNSFRVDIEINNAGIVKGKVYDLAFDEEYTNFRLEGNIGSFVSRVKEEFENILKDIKDICFIREDFIYDQSNRIAKAIKDKYGDEPEFEWEKFPGYATFKNQDSKKWYGIIMNLDKNKLDKKAKGEVEIINIKLEPREIEDLLKLDGFYPAYHMNKKSWISIILNDTLTDELILSLIEKSHAFTVTNKDAVKNEWIIPANSKYFDIEKALKENKTIMWKQSTDIKIGDIVYIYVAEPYSAIMYKFKVKEVNMPYDYQDENIKIQRAMKITLITKYEKDKLPFKKLNDLGIRAIRGPRYVPLVLRDYINKM